MNKGMLELMAEKVHNSWMEETKRQGRHHPKDCPNRKRIGVGCSKCHESMKPYNDLSESVKDLDRVMIKEFESSLNKIGGYITFPNSLRYITRRASDDLKDFEKFIMDNLKRGHDLVSLFWHWHEEHRVQGLELYCPKCGWDKKGFTLFEGLIAHACYPGCCCTIFCTKCKTVYGLQEDKKQTVTKTGFLISKQKRTKKGK